MGNRAVRNRKSSVTLLRRFFGADDGAVSVEYAVIGVGLGLAAMAGLSVLGPAIKNLMLSVLPGFL